MREGWIGVSGGHGEDRKGEVITEGMGGFQVPTADARPVTGRLTKPKPHQKNIPVLVFLVVGENTSTRDRVRKR